MKRGTWRHPKTIRLASALNISLAAATGGLQILWEWAGDYAVTGDLTLCLTEAMQDVRTSCNLSCPPSDIAEALIQTGWLDRTSNGSVVIHDWIEHCEEYVRKRIARKLAKGAADNGSHPPRGSDNGCPPSPARPSPARPSPATTTPEVAVAAAVDLALVKSLTDRGVAESIAKKWCAELPPVELREILSYFDEIRTTLGKPIGALKSMVRNPEKWDFVREKDGRLVRPPKPGVTAPRERTHAASEVARHLEEVRQGRPGNPMVEALIAELRRDREEVTFGMIEAAWKERSG